jgi:hypothetical protein
MANLKTSVIPLADLVPDAANVRLHPERNQQGVTASLRQFGPGRSIVLDGKNIVRAGNRTVASAQDAGIDEVIVVEPAANQLVAVRRPEWSPTEATAYGVSDNRTAEHAEWDEPALAKTLEALRNEGFNLDAIGFTDDELDELIAGLGNQIFNGVPPDDFPEKDESIETEHTCPKCGYAWSGGVV